jgi:aldose sugar dehydrogenase
MALRQFGRLRSVTPAPNGDLLITTDNGGGTDSILRVTPR